MWHNRRPIEATAALPPPDACSRGAQAQPSFASGNASNSLKVHLKHDPDFLNHFHRSDDK
jgi:hypothetical protein